MLAIFCHHADMLQSPPEAYLFACACGGRSSLIGVCAGLPQLCASVAWPRNGEPGTSAESFSVKPLTDLALLGPRRHMEGCCSEEAKPAIWARERRPLPLQA